MDIKPWQIVAVLILLALIALVVRIVSAFRKGRND